jgi:hypothetical protein
MSIDTASLIMQIAGFVKPVLPILSAIGFVWGVSRWYSKKENDITVWADRIENNHIAHIEAAVEETSHKLDQTNHLLEKGLDGIITEIRVLAATINKPKE